MPMADHLLGDSGISLEEAVAKIEQLENENRQLTHDLEACRDQLFDILQQENEIPEQRVKDEFIRIFEAIDSWIDDVSGDERFDFKANYSRTMHRNDRKIRFEDLGLEYECLEMPWVMKLGELETCHYVVLSLAITRCVVEDLFGTRPKLKSRDLFPPGILPEQMDFIKHVEYAMESDSETRREGQTTPGTRIADWEASILTTLGLDKNRYPKWRGETISALTSTDEYEKLCDKRKKEIDKRLKTHLEQWIDGERLAEHFRSLRRKVLDPAYKLLHTIGGSGKTYQVCLERITPGSIPPSDRSWNFKDMATWRTVPSYEIAGSIRYLYPGLVRKGYGDQRDLILVKPVALGYRHPGLQPQSSTSQPGARIISPVKPGIGSVESKPVNPPRTEQRRPEREPHETSRPSNKAPRADSGQKPPPQQALQCQPRPEHKQQKSDGGMLLKVGKYFGLEPTMPSSSLRAPASMPPKNDGKRSNRPGQIQKAGTAYTHPPGPEAEVREPQYRMARQDSSSLNRDRATVGPGMVTVDRSSTVQVYEGELMPGGYQYGQVWQWEPEGGSYARYGEARPPRESSG